jgi:hypothetical protein
LTGAAGPGTIGSGLIIVGVGYQWLYNGLNFLIANYVAPVRVPSCPLRGGSSDARF